MISYRGEDITLEEMPFGLSIVQDFHFDDGECVLIRSVEDAEAIIESLKRFIESRKDVV